MKHVRFALPTCENLRMLKRICGWVRNITEPNEVQWPWCWCLRLICFLHRQFSLQLQKQQREICGRHGWRCTCNGQCWKSHELLMLWSISTWVYIMLFLPQHAIWTRQNQKPVVMFLGWSNTYVAAAETHWMGIIYTDSSIECKEQQ